MRCLFSTTETASYEVADLDELLLYLRGELVEVMVSIFSNKERRKKKYQVFLLQFDLRAITKLPIHTLVKKKVKPDSLTPRRDVQPAIIIRDEAF